MRRELVPQAQGRGWQFIRRLLFGTLNAPERWDCTLRVTLSETDAYSLPPGVVRLRVARGKAWVSHLGEDLIVIGGQTLHLRPDRAGIVVTSTGHEPVELELYR